MALIYFFVFNIDIGYRFRFQYDGLIHYIQSRLQIMW